MIGIKFPDTHVQVCSYYTLLFKSFSDNLSHPYQPRKQILLHHETHISATEGSMIYALACVRRKKNVVCWLGLAYKNIRIYVVCARRRLR